VSAGNEIVHMQYKPSCVLNIDDHPDRITNDVPSSTHRTHFLHVIA